LRGSSLMSAELASRIGRSAIRAALPVARDA
jgi:hypothetical protein